MKEQINKCLNTALSAFLPEGYTCLFCGREIFSGRLCGYCAERLDINGGPCCSVCGRKLPHEGICPECKDRAPLFRKAVSPFVYDGIMPAFIRKFKTGQAYLADYFAGEIFKKTSCLPPFDGIVFVPMTKRAQFHRGYNQSLKLAESLSRLCGAPVLYNALQKVKQTRPQKFLTRTEREANLEGCFKADRKTVKDKVLLLIDDVTTTGATLNCVTAALLKARAKQVYAATIASVELKK